MKCFPPEQEAHLCPLLAASPPASVPWSRCVCPCEQVYCITTSTITITIIYHHHKTLPTTSSNPPTPPRHSLPKLLPHRRPIRALRVRQGKKKRERTDSRGRTEAMSRAPSAVRPASSTTGERRPRLPCVAYVCVFRCVSLCTRQRWVAEADWPAARGMRVNQPGYGTEHFRSPLQNKSCNGKEIWPFFFF